MFAFHRDCRAVIFSNSSEEVLLTTEEEIFDASNPSIFQSSSTNCSSSSIESNPRFQLPSLVQPIGDISLSLGEISPTSVSEMRSPFAGSSGQSFSEEDCSTLVDGENSENESEVAHRESTLEPRMYDVEESFNSLSSPRVFLHSRSHSKSSVEESIVPLVDGRFANTNDVKFPGTKVLALKRRKLRDPCLLPDHPLYKDVGGECELVIPS